MFSNEYSLISFICPFLLFRWEAKWNWGQHHIVPSPFTPLPASARCPVTGQHLCDAPTPSLLYSLDSLSSNKAFIHLLLKSMVRNKFRGFFACLLVCSEYFFIFMDSDSQARNLKWEFLRLKLWLTVYPFKLPINFYMFITYCLAKFDKLEFCWGI